MKIAVIGGGTAGYIATAHLSTVHKWIDLYHIYDSKIPRIGVGEGTTLNVKDWLNDVLDIQFDVLKERCYATKKYGISYENWGVKNRKFLHNFFPVNDAYAYHFSAENLVPLLEEQTSAERLDKNVSEIESNGRTTIISHTDGSRLEVDFAIDARGFPKTLDEEKHFSLSMIPTNAALIRSGPVVDFNRATRSVARPQGWIFIIPLRNRTSYGYVYNANISTTKEIEDDLNEFLKLEGVQPDDGQKCLSFPNYAYKKLFDGSLMRVGNAAAFFEPLEATAIGAAVAQTLGISIWPLGRMKPNSQKMIIRQNDLNVFNKWFYRYHLALGLFIGWHYTQGSAYNTPFWEYAKDTFFGAWEKLKNSEDKEDLRVCNEFQDFLTAASERINMKPKKEIKMNSFGIFPVESFVEIGLGIDYY